MKKLALAALAAAGLLVALAAPAVALDHTFPEQRFGPTQAPPPPIPTGGTVTFDVPQELRGEKCEVYALNNDVSIWTGNTITVEGLSATGFEDTLGQETPLGELVLGPTLTVDVVFSAPSIWTFPWPDETAQGNAGPFSSFSVGVECPEPPPAAEPVEETGPEVGTEIGSVETVERLPEAPPAEVQPVEELAFTGTNETLAVTGLVLLLTGLAFVGWARRTAGAK